MSSGVSMHAMTRNVAPHIPQCSMSMWKTRLSCCIQLMGRGGAWGSRAAGAETLKGRKRDRRTEMFDLFGESDLPIRDRLLKAYEHRDGWVIRLVLGDSLVVMNSLLHYERLGGQVQAIYMV